MHKLVVAIDGYSSCGKSTTAKLVAKELHYAYIDTGAMYRGVTLFFLENNLDWEDEPTVARVLPDIHISFKRNAKTKRNELFLNNENREDDIRTMRVSNAVSEVSVIPAVRHAMVAQQQRMGRKRGVVMDGRDIGTTVFPDAEVKVFMTADVHVRALRRQIELHDNGQDVPLDEIETNLQKRDRIDSTRAESPLRQAEDAIVLDTTHVTIDEQVDFVLDQAVKVMAHMAAAAMR
jgi:CMP/dCMP kinase